VPSSLSLGALLKHLALIEDLYFHTKLSGEPPGVAWDAADWDVDDWEFTSAANDTPEQLYHASLRRLVCDLIEEYGRHTGHADLLREAIDGRVGEDPPPGWAPKGSRRPAVDHDM
jgi:hypothetical protein